MRIERTIIVGMLLCAAACRTAVPAATSPTAIAPGVDLIRGSFVPGSQPDGNSIVFRGRDGLVVVDTGRHESHTRKILDLAKFEGIPIAAVVNTHWHLDHIGGNPLVRREYPNVRIYASGALEGAMKGFLANYRSQLESIIPKTEDPKQQEAYRGEIAIIDSGRALYPDETITQTGPRTIAGRKFDVHLETRTVTAGDVWLVDRESGMVVAGDLVTLPAPFLDTACPARWREALDRLASMNFKTLVPGHGAVMSKAGFLTYRTAFDRLLDCAASNEEKNVCADGWLRDAVPLIEETDEAFNKGIVSYYVDVLRGDPAKTATLCGS